MKNLIENQWIDKNTHSLIVHFTFYNISLKMFYTVRIMFENVGYTFNSDIDMGLIINNKERLSTYICVVFSVINIIFIILTKRRSPEDKRKVKRALEEEKEREIKKKLKGIETGESNLPFMRKLRKNCIEMKYNLKINFQTFGFFDTLSKK